MVAPMPTVRLDIADPVTRLTLEALLRAAGHTVCRDGGDVLVTDTPRHAVEAAAGLPALVVSMPAGLPEAAAAVAAGAAGIIHLPPVPGEAAALVRRALSGPTADPDTPAPGEDLSLAAAERRHLLRVVRLCHGNRAEAARVLGIGRNTLWRKLRDTGPTP